MKKFISVLLLAALVLSLCACSTKDAQDSISYNDNSEFSLSDGDMENAGKAEKVNVKTPIECLDACYAAARVEIADLEIINQFSYRYVCKVIEDYFGNLDYRGMDEGYISLYCSHRSYETGDTAHLFLRASEDIVYPHVLYFSLPSTLGFTDTKDSENGFVQVGNYTIYNGVEPLEGNDIFGIPASADLDSIIREYVKEHPKDTLEGLFPDIQSYEDMEELATEIWLIKPTYTYDDPNVHYIKGMVCEILAVYRTGGNVEAGNHAREMIAQTMEIDTGSRYLYFKGLHGSSTNQLSEEFCLLREGDPEFENILALVSGESTAE